MDVFSPNAPCSKCGSEDLHHRYRQKEERLDPDPLYFAKAECNLIRTYCRTCGYRWNSLPADEVKHNSAMVTIPLPIPVPVITLIDNEVKIDRTATELFRQRRESGDVLTFDKKKSLPLCSACKEPKAHCGTYEPPTGFRWGGWFCDNCLSQGKLASDLGLIIDQATCRIEGAITFDKYGMMHNANRKSF